MLQLTKHHGLGNDFLVALERDNPNLDPRAEQARVLCDRHRGVGADGLIYGLAGLDGADVRMVLMNADGSEAEISGNGIRCLGQAWLRATGRSEGEVVVDTAAGRRALRVVRSDGDETWIRVDMGEIRPGPELPVDPSELPG
ncbi:MAG: diaminopimelate epimerase, partial [Actinomycetes bacterium]